MPDALSLPSPESLSAGDRLRLAALAARFFPAAGALGGFDPELGAFSEDLLRPLLEAELARGQVAVALFRSTRAAEVARTRGPELAAQLLAQLGAALRGEARAHEWLCRAGADRLALIMPCLPAVEARERALHLERRVAAASRFPVAVGVAQGEGLPAQRLEELAARACEEAQPGALCALTPEGKLAPLLAPEAAAAEKDGVAARYQRLVLLNRISLELFGGKPFREALEDACRTTLALTGARRAWLYLADELGEPHLLLAHGDPSLGSAAEAYDALAKAYPAAGPVRLGRLAAVRLGRGRPAAADVTLVVAFTAAEDADAGLEQNLSEAARLLRNARLLQLDSERQRTLAAVVDQSPDAIFLTDFQGRILTWNEGARALYQYAPEEVIGQKVSLLAPPEKLAELSEIEANLPEMSAAIHRETVRRRKDGALVPVELTVVLLRGEDGEPSGTVRITRDITRRKEIERMKTEFVSMVSHELRTPLTSIRGFAETLAEIGEELKAEDRKRYLGIIITESKRLGNLVTDFLDISKLEAGGIPLRPKELDLEALARRAADMFKESPVSFKVDFKPEARTAWGDEDQIYRLLINLCGNAVKYSPPAGVVTVAGRRLGAEAILSVRDEGAGIPEADRQRIFEKFFRADDEVSRRQPGTGLGLAICRGIAQAHGGRIWAEEAAPRGTRFVLAFPAEALKG